MTNINIRVIWDSEDGAKHDELLTATSAAWLINGILQGDYPGAKLVAVWPHMADEEFEMYADREDLHDASLACLEYIEMTANDAARQLENNNRLTISGLMPRLHKMRNLAHRAGRERLARKRDIEKEAS